MLHLFRRRRNNACGHERCGRECRYKDKPCDLLADAVPETSMEITCNNDHKTVERGLCTGVQVRIIRNEPDEPNLIVAVGDARYVLDKRIARRIRVRVPDRAK